MFSSYSKYILILAVLSFNSVNAETKDYVDCGSFIKHYDEKNDKIIEPYLMRIKQAVVMIGHKTTISTLEYHKDASDPEVLTHSIFNVTSSTIEYLTSDEVYLQCKKYPTAFAEQIARSMFLGIGKSMMPNFQFQNNK